MCGITAMIGPNSYPEKQVMDEVLNRILHRGPDEKCIYQDQNCILGHVRLSVIDVSGGNQPIFNEDHSVGVVFNGEIYNHAQLRQGLDKHVFQTHSDTEVLVHLYEEHGTQMVKMLDGMFAFIIQNNKRVLAARDPLGIKPLYWGNHKGKILFCSEIKGLVGFVEQVKEFPPGHYYDSMDGLVRFHDDSFESNLAYENENIFDEKSLSDVLQQFKVIFQYSVVKRLMSDVPVGVFLSGGLDSSLVALVASRNITGLHTFTVGMKGSPDLEYAQEVASILKTIHHEKVYTVDEMAKVLPDVIYHLESFDAALVRSAIPCYFVSQLARNNVKVVLTGEGADELFCGYDYLKKIFNNSELHDELKTITRELHNTNLQRIDRMTMAHGIEGRVPFLDISMINMAFSLPMNLKYEVKQGWEKWIMRKAYESELPQNIIWRKKMKISNGAGSSDVFSHIADHLVSDQSYSEIKNKHPLANIRSKEELMYFNIYQQYYPDQLFSSLVGRSHSL